MGLILNANSKEIRVQFSKKKSVKVLFMSLCIGGVGIFLTLNSSDIAVNSSAFHPQPKEFIIIIGILTFSIGVLGLVATIYQIFDRQPALMIDDSGITIYGFMKGHRLIKWDQILRVSFESVKSSNFIAFHIKNTEDYVNSIKNPLTRMIANFSYKRYGYMLTISTYSLNCDDDELLSLLSERVEEYQKAERITHFDS